MTPQNNILANYGVLITRPSPQGELLGDMVRQRGGAPFVAPLLRIEFPDQIWSDFFKSGNSQAVAVCIFVSRYAAQAVCQGGRVHHLRDMKLAAMGAATKEVLEGYGVSVDYLPTGSLDSEGMLATLESVDLAGKRVIIFRGQSGREMLAEGMRARMAAVEQVSVYKRVWTEQSLDSVIMKWLTYDSRVITVTSGELIQRLINKVPDEMLQQVLQSNLVVLSERIANICLDLGFCKQVVVAEQADNSAIVDAVNKIVV